MANLTTRVYNPKAEYNGSDDTINAVFAVWRALGQAFIRGNGCNFDRTEWIPVLTIVGPFCLLSIDVDAGPFIWRDQDARR